MTDWVEGHRWRRVDLRDPHQPGALLLGPQPPGPDRRPDAHGARRTRPGSPARARGARSRWASSTPARSAPTDKLWCWGDNSAGQLGQGNTKQSLKRQQVAGRWSTVSAGGWTTCATKVNGSLWCWGRNLFGQLGDGSYADRSKSDPRRHRRRPGARSRCPGRTPAVAPAAARCAAGDATPRASSAPATRSEAPARRSSSGGHNAASIGVAEGTSCLVDDRRCLWCWGDNRYGQIGGRRRRHPDADEAGRDLLLGLRRLAARVRRQRRRLGVLGQQRARSARQRKVDQQPRSRAISTPDPGPAAQPLLVPAGLVQRARQRPLPAVRPRRPLRPQPDARGVDRAGADHQRHLTWSGLQETTAGQLAGILTAGQGRYAAYPGPEKGDRASRPRSSGTPAGTRPPAR